MSACDLGVLATSQYPEQTADRERSIRVLRGSPADIWVMCHGRWWGRYRKFVAENPCDEPGGPVHRPRGLRAFLYAAEVEFTRRTHCLASGPQRIPSTSSRSTLSWAPLIGVFALMLSLAVLRRQEREERG